ncbi:MAG: methylated-DNA--[protein]-cysteine S-methyltransferase [Phycisphaerales bacterium]
MTTLLTQPKATTRRDVRTLQTRFGRFTLMRNSDGTLHSTWQEDATLSSRGRQRSQDSSLAAISTTLSAYFAGNVAEHFKDVPTPEGPSFFRKCWAACRKIPAGSTITYAELARRAGSPRAARAAGQAMRMNPLPVIVPCHRVIGSDGKLHGFAGSTDVEGESLALKAALLQHEATSQSR